MKRNILIGCIIRDMRTIIPRGDDVIRTGDTVLVASINRQIARLEDILLRKDHAERRIRR